MDLKLSGQAALIVGGANGIGRAIAQALVEAGVHLVLWDIAAQTQRTADELAKPPRESEWVNRADGDPGPQSTANHPAVDILAQRVDVTRADEVTAAVAQLDDWPHSIQHVIYAAGAGSGQFGCPYWEVDLDRWQRVWEVNLWGAVKVAYAFGPRLASQRNGTFTFLASVAGQIGSPTDPPYSAAKAGLINFAQCMAQDLAPHNVRVNTICPGMVVTELNKSVWAAWNARQTPEQQLSYEAWGAAKVQRVTPLGRWQTPADVAHLTLFVISPLAQNITGQTLNVDGGQVMHT